MCSPQNPNLDSEALLALSLSELVQKLHSGELSPEAALFTYVGKVSGPRLLVPFAPFSSQSLHRLWRKPGLELRASVPGAAREGRNLGAL